MKTHLVRMRPSMWGGEVRSSLCNRLNAQSQDGMNVTDKRKEVTCKFCLKLMPKRRTKGKSAQ